MEVKNYIELTEALNSNKNMIELVNSINAVNTIKLREGQKLTAKRKIFF